MAVSEYKQLWVKYLYLLNKQKSLIRHHFLMHLLSFVTLFGQFFSRTLASNGDGGREHQRGRPYMTSQYFVTALPLP